MARVAVAVLVGCVLAAAALMAGARPAAANGPWTAQTAAVANNWRSVTYGNGLFVAVAIDGTHRVMTSSAADAPTVTGVAPNHGPVAGGTPVTVTGTGFDPAATASVGGIDCPVTGTTTATTLTCTTAAHSAGAVAVVVTNPDTQSGTRPGGYTYAAAAATQTPLNGCVTPGRTGKAIPRRGTKRLMKPGCITNAGKKVGGRVTARQRGDRAYYRLYCRVSVHKTRAVSKNASGYYCKKGALRIRTYGYKLRLRVTWQAPATTTYTAYKKVRTYRP